MGTSHRFQATHLRAIARQLLVAAGTPRHIADPVADILVNSDLAGHASHGVLHMPMYLRGILDGRIDPAAEPEVVKENTTVLFIDGRGGFGHYTARKAMDLAIEKAKLCRYLLCKLGPHWTYGAAWGICRGSSPDRVHRNHYCCWWREERADGQALWRR